MNDNIDNISIWRKRILEEIPNKTPKEKKLRKELINNFTKEFLSQGSEITLHEELNLLAIKNEKISLLDIKSELLNNKEFIKKYIEQNEHISYFLIPNEILDDDDIFLNIYKKDYYVYNWAIYRRTKPLSYELIKRLLEINGEIIKSLPLKYKDNIELVKIAIDQNVNNIKYIKRPIAYKIYNTEEAAKDLLNKNINYFKYIHPNLRKNRNFVNKYVHFYPLLLKHIPKKLCNDHDFINDILNGENSKIISYFPTFSKNITTDEQLMLKMIKANSVMFFSIDESLKSLEFFIAAVKENFEVYGYLLDEYKENPKLIHEFLKHNYHKEANNIVTMLPNNILENLRREYIDIKKAQFDKELKISFIEFVINKYLNLTLEESLVNKTITNKKKIKL